MRLSDVVSHLDLSIYPQIALVLFAIAFACVLWRALRSGASQSQQHASIPLADDPGDGDEPIIHEGHDR